MLADGDISDNIFTINHQKHAAKRKRLKLPNKMFQVLKQKVSPHETQSFTR